MISPRAARMLYYSNAGCAVWQHIAVISRTSTAKALLGGYIPCTMGNTSIFQEVTSHSNKTASSKNARKITLPSFSNALAVIFYGGSTIPSFSNHKSSILKLPGLCNG